LIKIKVPATTANLGPGFDCIGMALSIYNYVHVQEGTDNGEDLVIHGGDGVPFGEDNLIYKTIMDFYQQAGKKLPPLTIWQEDYIPMTRGLGSSAACVVAGLLAANVMAKTGLTTKDLIQMAAQIEGHPDNSTPALAGGLVVGAMTEQHLEYVRVPSHGWENLRFALMVPDFELSTEKARNVLPSQYSREDVIHNTSRAALLVAALINGDFEKLAFALDDRIHEPYRAPLVPNMDIIFKEARRNGACNAFLSGAGPSLIAVTENGNFLPQMKDFLRNLPNEWAINWVRPDFTGATIEM